MSCESEWELAQQPVCVPRAYQERGVWGPKSAKYRATKSAKDAAERRADALAEVVAQVAASLEAKRFACPDISPAGFDAAREAYVWGALRSLRKRFKSKPDEMKVFDVEVRRLLPLGPPPPKWQEPSQRTDPNERWPIEVVWVECLSAQLRSGRQRRAPFECPPRMFGENLLGPVTT